MFGYGIEVKQTLELVELACRRSGDPSLRRLADEILELILEKKDNG